MTVDGTHWKGGSVGKVKKKREKKKSSTTSQSALLCQEKSDRPFQSGRFPSVLLPLPLGCHMKKKKKVAGTLLKSASYKK